jgi:hypothetical protein
MLVAPRGPIMVRSSIKTYQRTAELLCLSCRDRRPDQWPGRPAYPPYRRLRGLARSCGQVAGARADLCRQDRFRPSPDRYRYRMLIDPGLRERLRYVSSHPHARPRPRDAYSPLVARQLRDAARADLVGIEARLRAGPRLTKFLRSRLRPQGAHTAIEARGVPCSIAMPSGWRFTARRWNRSMPAPDLNISAARSPLPHIRRYRAAAGPAFAGDRA